METALIGNSLVLARTVLTASNYTPGCNGHYCFIEDDQSTNVRLLFRLLLLAEGGGEGVRFDWLMKELEGCVQDGRDAAKEVGWWW